MDILAEDLISVVITFLIEDDLARFKRLGKVHCMNVIEYMNSPEYAYNLFIHLNFDDDYKYGNNYSNNYEGNESKISFYTGWVANRKLSPFIHKYVPKEVKQTSPVIEYFKVREKPLSVYFNLIKERDKNGDYILSIMYHSWCSYEVIPYGNFANSINFIVDQIWGSHSVKNEKLLILIIQTILDDCEMVEKLSGVEKLRSGFVNFIKTRFEDKFWVSELKF